MSNFTHLHLHSEYSLLDGCLRIGELARAAGEKGFSSLALTDHGATYGLVPFYQEMKKAGLHPVLGAEIYLEPPTGKTLHHLVLLAENNDGLQNLLQLVTMAHLDNFRGKPLVKKEWLPDYHTGLIALSGCIRGEIPQRILEKDLEGAERALGTMVEIFGRENFFVELQRHGLPKEELILPQLVALSGRNRVGMVATNDVHYEDPTAARTHELLLAVQTLTTLAQENRLRLTNTSYDLKPGPAMAELFYEYPEAVTHTEMIARRCRVELELGKLRIPYFPAPEGETAETWLRKLCEAGMARKFPGYPALARERLEYELSVICRMHLAGYFLIVWDLVAYARKLAIPVGPGRGSAVGSLVAYLLDITEVNPLEFGLLFERFLNPDRVGMPDIDIDLCHRGRPRVLEYLRKKYGRDRVAHLAAYTTLKPRAAVRDVGRALGVDYETVGRITRVIPYFSSSLTDALAESGTLREIENRPEIREMMNYAVSIAGLPRHLTQHAAGVVIADGPLTGYLALEEAGGGEIVTQGDMHVVEDLGLVKIDVLGLRYLTVIDQTLQWLNRAGNPLKLETIPLDDPEIYRAIGGGNTIGTFQLESGGMRRLLRRYRPENLNDLAAILALFRPGPLGGGAVESYIRRRFGKEPVIYHHPALHDVLEDTYGIILYQEQVMQVAQSLAGYTPGEADFLRKAIAKRNPEVLSRQRESFVSRAVERGVAEETASQVFDQINEFGHYGFPKGHAVAYAFTSYRSVYLKTYYPREYHAALLSLNWGTTDRFCQYLSEIRYRGLAMLRPDINCSEVFFTPEPKGIRAGLIMVRDLGDAGLKAIIEERKAQGTYCSLADFCRRLRVRHAKISLKAVQNLIKCGAFDGFGMSRPELLLTLGRHWTKKVVNDPGQLSLFGPELLSEMESDGMGSRIPDYPDEVKWELEREILGHYISRNPLESYRTEFKAWKVRENREILEDPTVEQVVLCGFLSGVRGHRTKLGKRMYFAVLEDLSGLIDLVFFPTAVAKYGYAFVERRPLLIKGRIDRTEETPSVIVEEVRLIS